MSESTNLLKHFMTMGVRTTRLQTLRHFTGEFLGTGMMVDDLKHVGTAACFIERLLSWLVHVFNVHPGTPSFSVVDVTWWHC